MNFLAAIPQVLPINEVGQNPGGALTSTFGPIILSLLVLALLVAGALMIRWYLQGQGRIPRALESTVLLVALPRESWRQELEDKDWREILAGFETLFVTLGSLRPASGDGRLRSAWRNLWSSQSRQLALELVSHRGQLFFYLAVPRDARQLVELQIQAQYPHAHIEEVTDYNLFGPQSFILATSLQLTKPAMFPIRTYKRLDNDPLFVLTNVLSKVQSQEGAAIQMLIRPQSKGWQQPGRELARRLQEGQPLASRPAGKAIGFLTASLQTSRDSQMSAYRGVPNITPLEQELIRTLEEKAGKPGFSVNIRIITASPLERNARVHLENIINAFSQFTSLESGNGFRARAVQHGGRLVSDFIYRHFRPSHRMLLNSEEINSLYHFPLPDTPAPNIHWLAAKKAAAPTELPSEGIILGHNLYRGEDRVIRLQTVDRRRHAYIIGTTGSGKSVLMASMAKQDVAAGHGVGVVDPHGSLIEEILEGLPSNRLHDVVLFEPADLDRPVGLNMLEAHRPEERDFAVQEMIAIFMKLFPPEVIGPMFEHNMRNAMLTLMEDEDYPGTIADIPRIFTDKGFQQYKVSKVKDPVVRAFWEKEMAKTSDFHKSEMLGYLISKVGRFVENSMMRNIIGQPRSGFNFREIMDQQKILLVNLSKGKVGEVNANLLGLIIVAKLQMAALSRADQPEAERPDFFLYLDEFQNFITDSIATILSEARKYRLNLTMAHQYMGQLVQGTDTRVRDAVLGNIGTMIAFRVGVEDAETLEKQFAPTFNAFDLVNQERFTAYLRLLVNNTVAPPFHLQSYPPRPGQPRLAEAVRKYSRLRYGKDRRYVEADILERTKLGATSPAVMPVAGEAVSR
ncbi:MAG: type IV secretion system DNA-binding domain-containing protein [Candidatus Kerfeldbacteria bacterium]|nr:type IV secretion system DNA-binding domain-containing protein [Candidatus Kerfeldbacteria bacterium]